MPQAAEQEEHDSEGCRSDRPCRPQGLPYADYINSDSFHAIGNERAASHDTRKAQGSSENCVARGASQIAGGKIVLKSFG